MADMIGSTRRLQVMWKRGPRQHKQPNMPPPKPKSLLEIAMTHPAVALISLIATLAGLFLGALILFPRVVVSSPSGPMESGNIFDASLEVSNSGFIPLTDTGACLVVGRIIARPIEGPNVGKGPKLRPGFRYPDAEKQTRACGNIWQHHNLSMDDRFTIKLTDVLSRASEADIAVVVNYQPWFLPWRREKSFRFIAATDSTGKIDWRAWPFTEPSPTN
jgi:hypothetical protein